MKKFRILLIIITISISSSFAQNQSLKDLIDIALQVSPELKMYEAIINASENRIQQNSNLQNPMISFGVMSLPVPSLAFNKEMMTAKVIGLSQEFPFPGMLSAKETANKMDVEIARQQYKDKSNEIIKELTQSYYELIYVRKEIELTEKSRQLMKQILEVVRSMFSVADASQQNVFRVELELTKMSEMIASLKSEEAEQLSVVNSLLLRDPAAELETDSLPKLGFIQVNVDELISKAEMNRPFLKGILNAEEKAKLNQTVAEYDFYPMFRLSAQYAFREKLQPGGMPQENMISVMLDITLPLNYGGKVTAMVEETKSMQQMYRQQYTASVQMLRREFGMALAKLKSLKERIELIERGSLVQAKENFSSAMTAYQVSEIDFMNVIEAQNNLYMIEKNLYRLKTDYLKQIAELEFLTGTKL
ncbi:Outer membrane efflux protein [Ignavibacterium album JCM 16511]|uniref:Outer membrane efflux protein n=1 Tax=Ignavibacterium album (strain DSM 19864 / JCM 16511 / NBRC 101810 / Mat9-16) TaxID=945713 RepID=I0AHX0_IGNAJ|nr:TolC family protein [Ignavibacterium album]AFH48577.1 Outer membrane efflux protein [Ignavibacterium album JCM 16511]